MTAIETPVETPVINENGLLPEELVEVPTFKNTPNCDPELIKETRQLLIERYNEKPENFYKNDINLILSDDWSVSRFLLRCRLDPLKTVDLMEASSIFRIQFKMGETEPSDFPAEMYDVGAIFKYAPDRVGNVTLWMRVQAHRRSTEMSHITKQFILCTMEQCDRAVKGRGVSVVFDLTNCGIKNADPTFLFWLLNSFRTYMPKGLSYILVYNLPWVLNATCQLAMSWLSSTNRKRLRFIEKEQIFTYIAPENCPYFIPGGSCTMDYRQVPEGCRTVESQPDHKLVPITEGVSHKMKELHKKLTADIY